MTNRSLATSYLLKARKRRLRKEREASLYGDIDFIPTEQYGIPDAQRAMDDARFVLDVVTRVTRSNEDTN